MGLSTITTSEATPKKWGIKPVTKPRLNVSYHTLEERNGILVRHLPQVHYIAGRIHDRLPRHVPLEDLVHAGVLGLMEALQKYDPSKNVQLQSYAKVRIRGAILDSLREMDWSPRTLRKRARQIESANQTLRTRLGRAPSDTELALQMGISLKKFQHLLGDLHGLEVISLQAMGVEDGYGDEGSRYLPHSSAEDPSHACLRLEMNNLLASAMSELAPRKRQILALYYFDELTMKEVGARLGVGESRVSQIHTATLARLRFRMRQLLESHARQMRALERESQGAGWVSSTARTNPVTAAANELLRPRPSMSGDVLPSQQLRFPWQRLATPAENTDVFVGGAEPPFEKTVHLGRLNNRVADKAAENVLNTLFSPLRTRRRTKGLVPRGTAVSWTEHARPPNAKLRQSAVRITPVGHDA